MLNYWFDSYDEQLEYQRICKEIRMITKDLKNNNNMFERPEILRMNVQLDDLKRERQSMHDRGHILG